MGYCLNPPALVYEYVSKGSLYENLHDLNVSHFLKLLATCSECEYIMHPHV